MKWSIIFVEILSIKTFFQMFPNKILLLSIMLVDHHNKVLSPHESVQMIPFSKKFFQFFFLQLTSVTHTRQSHHYQLDMMREKTSCELEPYIQYFDNIFLTQIKMVNRIKDSSNSVIII